MNEQSEFHLWKEITPIGERSEDRGDDALIQKQKRLCLALRLNNNRFLSSKVR